MPSTLIHFMLCLFPESCLSWFLSLSTSIWIPTYKWWVQYLKYFYNSKIPHGHYIRIFSDLCYSRLWVSLKFILSNIFYSKVFTISKFSKEVWTNLLKRLLWEISYELILECDYFFIKKIKMLCSKTLSLLFL